MQRKVAACSLECTAAADHIIKLADTRTTMFEDQVVARYVTKKGYPIHTQAKERHSLKTSTEQYNKQLLKSHKLVTKISDVVGWETALHYATTIFAESLPLESRPREFRLREAIHLAKQGKTVTVDEVLAMPIA